MEEILDRNPAPVEILDRNPAPVGDDPIIPLSTGFHTYQQLQTHYSTILTMVLWDSGIMV